VLTIHFFEFLGRVRRLLSDIEEIEPLVVEPVGCFVGRGVVLNILQAPRLPDRLAASSSIAAARTKWRRPTRAGALDTIIVSSESLGTNSNPTGSCPVPEGHGQVRLHDLFIRVGVNEKTRHRQGIKRTFGRD
jgi:hypothetical protein